MCASAMGEFIPIRARNARQRGEVRDMRKEYGKENDLEDGYSVIRELPI